MKTLPEEKHNTNRNITEKHVSYQFTGPTGPTGCQVPAPLALRIKRFVEFEFQRQQKATVG